jgi:hypothetical protein
MHNRRIAGLTGARTTLVITHPFRAPHRTISDVGLIGGRLVKNVARLSSQQAGYPEPVHRHTEGIFTNRLILRRCGWFTPRPSTARKGSRPASHLGGLMPYDRAAYSRQTTSRTSWIATRVQSEPYE